MGGAKPILSQDEDEAQRVRRRRSQGATDAQIMNRFNQDGDCPSWTHPAPCVCPSSAVSLHRVDNNHLLLLMIHVFRENEEQLFRVRWSWSISHEGPALSLHQLQAESSSVSTQMIRMSTGHMEGNLQLIYVLLTDCYVYLIRKGLCSAARGGGFLHPWLIHNLGHHSSLPSLPAPPSSLVSPRVVAFSVGSSGWLVLDFVSVQGQQRSRTWWRRPFPITSSTTFR